MFGLLNEADEKGSLDPDDYARQRGRFYLIWNASKISGRPALVTLMAGNAAHDAETTRSDVLLSEINERLGNIFPSEKIPTPSEVIVTRWKRDPFTRGTYSYVGPRTRSGDYDLMAEPVGNLHFAGEATCGTHPATVHGAFLSGLRVAAEVATAMTGPIDLPTPLVGAAPIKQDADVRYAVPSAPPTVAGASQPRPSLEGVVTLPQQSSATPIIKQEPGIVPPPPLPSFAPAPALPLPLPPKKLAGPPRQSVCSGDASFWAQPTFDSNDLDYEANIIGSILTQIGDRPIKPARPGVNPFLLFTKAKWDECKEHCGGVNGGTSGANTAGRDAIRATLGKWWKAASEEEKQPYLDQSDAAQKVADAQRKEWAEQVEIWDREAKRIRREYMEKNPPAEGKGGDGFGGKRKSNNSSCVVLDLA